MKLTITTLTGDKFDVEVKADDKVKDLKVSNKGHSEERIVIQTILVNFCSHFKYFI